ncbi:MAG: co-chaperone YbbN [Pseudomonadota bacterium]|nr:co-chaperone YbbN [Pseudomonadota bacterium]
METLEQSQNIIDGSDQSFMADVIEKSKEIPVIVDFWAPWCGPCKTLGPALETEIKAYPKDLKLVKINIDENPAVAGQLRVQSIPAVFAFVNGQPVDGFMGAQTGSQIKEFIKKLLGSHGKNNNGLDSALETGKSLLEEGDYNGAVEIFEAIIKEDDNKLEAYIGLIKSFLALEDLESAKATEKLIPEGFKGENAVKTVHAQIQLVEQTQGAGDVAALRNKVSAAPSNFEARFELALALISQNENREAIDTLLDMFRDDPTWEDGKAKNQLLDFLDSLGEKNEDAKSGRRRLSSLIFS